MDHELKKILHEKGADIVRFVDISELSPEQTQGFTKAILLSMVLHKKFLAEIRDNLQPEGNEFAEKEKLTDELADWLAEFLQGEGYRAYSQSEKSNGENGCFDEETQSSNLPHKTIARLAGLGFIGKNNLLVTQEYGCALSMCTVLTDAPITVENYPIIPSKCGKCNDCKDICPVCALHGNDWTPISKRDDRVDASKCILELKCMVYCPWTLKYIMSEE